MGLYFGFISSFFSLSSIGLWKKIKVEETRIKEQIAKNGGIIQLKNLTLLFKPNLTFFVIVLEKPEFFIVTFDDSVNWSKQFIVSDNNELPIFKVNGFTFGLELLRTILWIWRLSAFISINLDLYIGISFLIKRFE